MPNVENEVVYGGYTRKQLINAFEKVQNKKNWKKPINTHIKNEDRDITEKAIVFFTGSIPEFKAITEKDLYVKAGGYFSSINNKQGI